MSSCIWCVEDDANVRDIEIYTLEATGFEVEGFENAESIKEALNHRTPDLIVLDIMLPKTNGVELLDYLKNNPATSAIPVIMATAKGTEFDKVVTLDKGADDYLVKPFGMMEMVSRIKAVLRRTNKTNEEKKVLTYGPIELDLSSYIARVDGEEISLTYKEFELLKLFISRPGMVFTRDLIFNKIWGIELCFETRTVDVHIRTLRQKLNKYSDMIVTVRNVGYRLELKNHEEKDI